MIPCPTCEATGEICPGWTRATFHCPPEPLPMVDCPICEGTGEVSGDEPENWDEWPPSEEDAVDLLAVYRERAA